MKQDVFEYLNKLRESGEVNLLGLIPTIQEKFGLTYNDARNLVVEWINNE